MKKKIVFFIESLHVGGAEKSLLSLLSALDRDMYEIDLLLVKKGGEFENLVPKEVSCKTVKLNIGLKNRIQFFLSKKFLSKRHNAQYFWESVKDSLPTYPKNYDVAVGWGQGFATYFTAEKIKAEKKFAWVNTDYHKAGYIFRHDESIYNKYTKVIAISEHVKAQLQTFIPVQKLVVVHNIIDSDEIRQKSGEDLGISFDSSVFNIVSVGRLVKIKAFDLAIKAANLLSRRGLKFHWYIIGEGAIRNELESLINTYELSDKVFLWGFSANPYPFIKAADVYVQTSLFEGLGRTLVEASILQRPIISTNFPTAYSLIKDGETGFVTEMTPEAVADKIELLMVNEQLKKSMSQNNIAEVEARKKETLDRFSALISQR